MCQPSLACRAKPNTKSQPKWRKSLTAHLVLRLTLAQPSALRTLRSRYRTHEARSDDQASDLSEAPSHGSCDSIGSRPIRRVSLTRLWHKTAQMSRSTSDLVEDSKLDTTFGSNTTRHAIPINNPAGRLRQAKAEEIWERSRLLGAGSSGEVWLERCIAGSKSGSLRAVKSITKQKSGSPPIDYSRELEAIAKFSGKKVSIVVAPRSNVS